MSIIKIDYGEVGGSGGEQVDVELTGTSPNYSATIDIENGFVGVYAAGYNHQCWCLFKIENGVKTDVYTNSSVSATYQNGQLTVNVNSSNTVYLPFKLYGYKA